MGESLLFKLGVFWRWGLQLYVKWVIGMWIGLILWLLSGSLWATTTEAPRLVQKKALWSLSKYVLTTGLEQQSYYNSQSEFSSSKQALPQATVIQLGFEKALEPETSGWRFHIQDHFTSYDQEHYLELYQAHYQWFFQSRSLKNYLQLGRVHQKYFDSESHWNLGLWQPRTTWDRLDSEPEGLIGLFYQGESAQLKWRLFYLAAHLPELVKTRVEQQKIVSQNPWFLPPPDKIKIVQVEGETPVYHDIAAPPEEAIVNHQGIGTYLQWQRPKGSYLKSVRWGYAYKPMNQILLGAPMKLNLPDEGQQSLYIKVYPRILYHHISTLELETTPESGHWSWTHSLTYESPIRDVTPDSWLTQEVEEATLFTTTFMWPTLWGEASLSLLKVWGGDAPHKGPIDITTPLFESRYLWKSAASLRWSSPFKKIGRWTHQLRLNGTLDTDQHGGLFSAQLKTQWRPQLSSLLGVDLLGIYDESLPEPTPGFVRDFRTNDRVRVGVNYVF